MKIMPEEMVEVLKALAKIETRLDVVLERLGANHDEIKELDSRVKDLETYRDTDKGGRKALIAAVGVAATLLGIVVTLLTLSK